MLFSATLDGDVDKLVRRFLQTRSSHSVDPGTAAVTTMTHHVLHVDAATSTPPPPRSPPVRAAPSCSWAPSTAPTGWPASCCPRGVRAAALHGGKSQPQRTRILEQFRTGQVTALVATDVAARGIHVDDLDMVVNVDPPTDAKDYLHRGGRTARAGESGTVVTLVLPEQRREVSRLMADRRHPAAGHPGPHGRRGAGPGHRGPRTVRCAGDHRRPGSGAVRLGRWPGPALSPRRRSVARRRDRRDRGRVARRPPV